jgi:hypothetical protein
MAREAVKLVSERRDNRRTCQFRNHRIKKEAGISQQRSCDILPEVLGSVIHFVTFVHQNIRELAITSSN